jgi:DNA recombination protein RmuC
LLVIDAKAPLQAYLEACESVSHDGRMVGMQGHAKKVRGHIERLSQKKYWEQFAESPDFVILFLPGEAFFSSALEHDPLLLEYGVERNVVLATPSTLLALLRVVAYGWTQAELHQNALKILDEAHELYARLGTFSEHFKEVRKGLEKAARSYNQAVSSFDSRLLVSARKLEAMKVGREEGCKSPGVIDSSSFESLE